MNKRSALDSKSSQFFLDVIVFAISYIFSYLIRFEGIPSGIFFRQIVILFPAMIALRSGFFIIFSIYAIEWRFISIPDAIKILQAVALPSLFFILGRFFIPLKLSLLIIPYSVSVMEFLFVLFATLGIRLGRRHFFEISERDRFEKNIGPAELKRALLIGAGNAGNMVVKELLKRPDLGFQVMGFIDDDVKKIRTNIQGVKVLGSTEQIPKLARKLGAHLAIITIANASSKDIRRIVGFCSMARINVRIIPGLFEIINENVKVTKIRDINIDDLLGRNVIQIDSPLFEIAESYRGKRILVTGAGGSIGSELCRQLMSFNPQELIILDKDEFGIYELEGELLRKKPTTRIIPRICNVAHVQRLSNIVKIQSPQIIFHAAAHKHVPLMELNISEAILNNVLGTRNIAQIADALKVEKLIFISTDKAVNPTSIMGSTKKIGEILIQEISSRSSTQFACVRFGNVLASRGSVVPLFQKQLAEGGPITITHPDVRRYFMSIFEAVQLILKAGTLGSRGEIFVLDMGEPVKIVDLAKEMIKLSGFREDDVEISYVGLRPGEKLYEEILIDEEKDHVTKYKKLFIAPPIETNSQEFQEKLDLIIAAALEGDEDRIIKILANMNIGFAHTLNSHPPK